MWNKHINKLLYEIGGSDKYGSAGAWVIMSEYATSFCDQCAASGFPWQRAVGLSLPWNGLPDTILQPKLLCRIPQTWQRQGPQVRHPKLQAPSSFFYLRSMFWANRGSLPMWQMRPDLLPQLRPEQAQSWGSGKALQGAGHRGRFWIKSWYSWSSRKSFFVSRERCNSEWNGTGVCHWAFVMLQMELPLLSWARLWVGLGVHSDLTCLLLIPHSWHAGYHASKLRVDMLAIMLIENLELGDLAALLFWETFNLMKRVNMFTLEW